MTSPTDAFSRTVARSIPPDPLYGLRAFDLAGVAVDHGTRDVLTLARRPGTRLVADQLLRSLGSVTANIAEGYSRSTGPDRARFYEYALGSAREAREWYRASRGVLDPADVTDRQSRLDAVVALLVGLARDARTRSIRGETRSKSG